MKTKIIISFILFLSIAAFIIEKPASDLNNSSISSPPASKDSEFLINVMHSGIDLNYSEYPDLNTNAWHIYCGPGSGWPGVTSDDIYHLPSVYGPSLINKIEENRTYGFRSIMERPRTVHLGYSQRSDYQCETLAVGDDYWFYAYNTHQAGNDINDFDFNGNGARVRYCQTNPSNIGNNSGYVVKGLRANREQSNKLWTPMHNDDTYDWFVMPRIRIDTSVLNINLDTKVCAVVMLDWNGNTIDSVDILAKNFRDPSLHYNGDYIEEYNFSPFSNKLQINPGVICPGPAKQFWDWDNVSIKTDYRVYWYGLCDMWIDYVRVENLPAHEFFNASLHNWDSEVRAEALFAKSGYDANHPVPNNFYLEEFEFNMVPSIKHFNELVMDETQNEISLMPNLNYSLFKVHIPNAWSHELSPEQLDRYLVSRANIKYAVLTGYPLEGFEESSGRQSYHPTTLSSDPYDKEAGILSFPASVTNYEDSLQNQLDIRKTEGFVKILSRADSLSKIVTDLNLILLEQAHLHFAPTHKLKEPTNEEMKVMATIAITYGAKGIMYFAYNSANDFSDTAFYQRGLVEPFSLDKRTQSVYGQNKWEGVKQINSTLKKWGPYLMGFDNINRKSFIVRSEISKLTDSTYFNDILSYQPDPYDFSIPVSLAEPIGQRYLQAAVFKNPDEEYSKYFMIVNRRCSPIVVSDSGGVNGRRSVTIKLDSGSSIFPDFNNWGVYDLEKDTLIKSFDKRLISTIHLSWFLPGEGKLYKIAPVMQEGGTLVADEDLIGNFDCNGLVNNNGKNITLRSGTTINFANSDARIIMNGGNFKSGINTGDNTAPVNLQGKDTLWKGIVLQDCPSVEMYKTYFKDISPYEMDSTYAVDLVNCLYSKIDGCSFLADQDLNTGGIRANYTFIGEYPVDAYFLNSTFQMSNENIPALSFISSGGITVPLIIDGNTFTSDEGNSANAIFLCNVSGGAIKNNTITDYKTGIFLLSSAMDLYNNVIDGSSDNSIGIKGASQSALGLGSSGNYFTAGLNSVTSDGDDAICIFVDRTSFDLHKGENIFDLKNYSTGQSNSYHLSGHFPDYQPNTTVSAVQNCFRLSGSNTNELQNVNWVSGDPINFDFLDYSCEISEPEEKLLVDLGNGNTDTIYFMSGGSGGGMNNYELGIKNYDLKNGGENVKIVSMESLIDSININTRKRNYNRVLSDCQEYLNNHLYDSNNTGDQSTGIISKLFLASLRLDVTGNEITELKTLLENLILNNPQNESLIKSTFIIFKNAKLSLVSMNLQ